MYLTQKLVNYHDTNEKDTLLQSIINGSVVSWQHISLLGEYDFSDERLKDSVGIKPPKLIDVKK